MKIINEIEKSRLNEENMNLLKGGDNSCGTHSCEKVNNQTYKVTACATKIVCPKQYVYCAVGSAAKESCLNGFWTPHF